ncbi:MAG TPA: sugar-binding protein [Candidatus Rubrimentiphilum sp.]|nr:sugar-binding protein [Candidatus Rubrimentiphilum sp.]
MLNLVLAATIVSSPVPASATAAYVGTRVAIPRVTSVPPIDGDLTHPQWAQAAKIALDFNLRDHQPARETTTILVMTDGNYLYVGADARQREPIQATQRTNDVSLDNDDSIEVDLWPSGANGFRYEFIANPIGTHFARSSENTAYSPRWLSAGKVSAGGYTVAMRIPLAAIRSGGSDAWNAQFLRAVATTQDEYEWQHAPAQQTDDDTDILYSGVLTGLRTQSVARARPRIGIYGLASIASKTIGGSTSRMGADLSIPLTAGTSFIATLHPDYSNVELDQQTITPTAFARQFNEVRPFFTQGANFYGNGYCVGCTYQDLYTPAIPTPRDGYAIEGKQGEWSFGGFDAAGISRNDTAQALNFNTPDQKYSASFQRVAVDLPGFHDVVNSINVAHNSQRGLWEYVGYGKENGTAVTDGSQGIRKEAGVGFYDQTGGILAVIRKIGAEYSPLDGFIQLPGIAGYDVNADKTWYFKNTAFIPRFIAAVNIDRYHGVDGRLNQSDSNFAVGADVRPLMHVRAAIGSSYVRLPDGTFTPVSSNGVDLYFHYHTTTPTQISWYQGRFGPGHLSSWFTNTTQKVGARSFVGLEADENIQLLDNGTRYAGWLERATYTYQNGQNSTLGIGVRRIIGSFPVLENIANPSLGAWNLSAAFYQRLSHAELYAVYGDANAFSTAPQFIVKFIQYLGAEKGT